MIFLTRDRLNKIIDERARELIKENAWGEKLKSIQAGDFIIYKGLQHEVINVKDYYAEGYNDDGCFYIKKYTLKTSISGQDYKIIFSSKCIEEFEFVLEE